MSEMSDFSNKNVHFFAPYLHIFALISRVDFSQPKCVGRLKSTLPAKPKSRKRTKIGNLNNLLINFKHFSKIVYILETGFNICI